MTKTWDDYCAEHDLTRLLDVIREDCGDAPCCHWGTKSWMWERAAVAVAIAFEDSTGDDYSDPDLMDGVLSQVVNDSDGHLAYTIMSCRHALPADFLQWLETDDFTDSDKALEARLSDIASMANGAWHLVNNLRAEVAAPWVDWDSFMLAPLQKANDLAWGAITDYWDAKEE